MAVAGGERALEVTLRKPIPFDEPLTLDRRHERHLLLRSGETVLAEATDGVEDVPIPAVVSIEEATASSRSYPGFAGHPFPRCFCCGPTRKPGDGLRIFPGPVPGKDLVAASWVPPRSIASHGGTVPPEIIWSALDCPAIWALMLAAPADSEAEVVSGRFSTRIVGEAQPDQRYVVIGWPAGGDERKLFGGAAILDQAGEVVAVSLQTCILVEGGVPLGSNR